LPFTAKKLEKKGKTRRYERLSKSDQPACRKSKPVASSNDITRVI
jgi:hypothetical protein